MIGLQVDNGLHTCSRRLQLLHASVASEHSIKAEHLCTTV
jgi:hypothetical protein